MTGFGEYTGDLGVAAVRAQLQAWDRVPDSTTDDLGRDVKDIEWRRLVEWPAFAAARFDESAVAEAGAHGAANEGSNVERVSVPAAWREDIARQLACAPIGASRVLVVRCPDGVSQRIVGRSLISSLGALNRDGLRPDVFANLPDSAVTHLISPRVLLGFHWLSGEGDDDPQSEFLADMEEASPGDWTDQLRAVSGIPVERQWRVFSEKRYSATLSDAPPSFTVLMVDAPSERPAGVESHETTSTPSKDGSRLFPYLNTHLKLLGGALRNVSTKRGPSLVLVVDDADPRLPHSPAAAHMSFTLQANLSQWLGTTALDYADAILQLQAMTGGAVLHHRRDTPEIVRESCPACAWEWVGDRLKRIPAVEANVLPLEPLPGNRGGGRRRRPAAEWCKACELYCPLERLSPLADVGNEPNIEAVTLRDSFFKVAARILALGPEAAGASFADVFKDLAQSLRQTPTSLRSYRTLIEQQLFARTLAPIAQTEDADSDVSQVRAPVQARFRTRLHAVLGTATDADAASTPPWELTLRAWPGIRVTDKGTTGRRVTEMPMSFVVGRKAPLTIDQLDANALRIAECLRNWFSELREDDPETLREIGFGPDRITEERPVFSLADALGWMRDPGSEGAGRRWKPISTMAEELAEVFDRRRWREELRTIAKRTSVSINLAEPATRRTNARYAQALLSQLLNLAPSGPLGPPGAVRQLREAITRIKSDGGGLTEALRRLEALMKYLIVSTGLLIPRASWQRWRRGGEDRAPLPEVATIAQTELLEHVGALEMSPLMNLWSQLRSGAHEEMRVCYGDTDPWARFKDIIEPRNKTVHHRAASRSSDTKRSESVSSPHGDAELIAALRELAEDPAPWRGLPLLAEVLDERVGHLGTRVTFRTELGEDVVAPLHFVDGLRWGRGELVAHALLLVSRGQLADWSHPVAIVYRADLLESFCGTTRVAKA